MIQSEPQLSLLEEAPQRASTRASLGEKQSTEPVVLLLSIRPEHADRIFAGSKHFELRKALPNRPLRRVFLYVSGTGGVVGSFDPAEVIRAPIESLWRRVGTRAATRERFFQYFTKADVGYAIRVASPTRFARPIDIKQLRALLPGLMAPMSYLALRPDDPISVELEAARREAAAHLPPLVTLRSISDSERPEYRRLVGKHIGANYDEIDETFASRTLEVHDLRHDPLGFFTSEKQVFAIENMRKKLVGFTTVTLKSGGSLKSGPTIILEKYRNRGFGRATRRAIEEHALAIGARKVYCTAPASSFSTVRYLLAAGMTVEAQLSCQYTTRHDELVFGKFVLADDSCQVARPRYKQLKGEIATLASISRRDTVAAYRRMFAATFHDISAKKVREILRVAPELSRVEASAHARKPRQVVCLASRGVCRAFVTVVPKRGGAMKAVLIRETDHRPSIARLVDEAMEIGRGLSERKIYFLHPLLDGIVLEELVDKGFRSEGVLRAPYRAGDDVIVLSRFL